MLVDLHSKGEKYEWTALYSLEHLCEPALSWNTHSHLESQTAGIAALKRGSHVLDQFPQTCILILQFGNPVLRFLQSHYLLVALFGAGAEPAAGGVSALRGGGTGPPAQQLPTPPQGASQADLSLYVLAVLPDEQPAVLILTSRLGAEVSAQLGVEVSESELAGYVLQNPGAVRVLRVFVQSQNFTQDVEVLGGDFLSTLIVHMMKNLL